MFAAIKHTKSPYDLVPYLYAAFGMLIQRRAFHFSFFLMLGCTVIIWDIWLLTFVLQEISLVVWCNAGSHAYVAWLELVYAPIVRNSWLKRHCLNIYVLTESLHYPERSFRFETLLLKRWGILAQSTAAVLERAFRAQACGVTESPTFLSRMTVGLARVSCAGYLPAQGRLQKGHSQPSTLSR